MMESYQLFGEELLRWVVVLEASFANLTVFRFFMLR